MSNTARFTKNSQSQISFQQLVLESSAEATKAPMALAVDAILNLVDELDFVTLYKELSSIPVRTYKHRDLIYVKSTQTLWMHWAPLGENQIINYASGTNTNYTVLNGQLDTDTSVAWKDDSLATTAVTCSEDGNPPIVSVDFSDSPPDCSYLTLAVVSTRFAGIKSYMVQIGNSTVYIEADEPDQWAVLSNYPLTAGVDISIAPASPDDVQAGDVFFIAPVIVSDKQISPDSDTGFEDAMYYPTNFQVDNATASALMTQTDITYNAAKVNTVSLGSVQPTNGVAGDLWANTLSTALLYVFNNGAWKVSDAETVVQLYPKVVQAQDTADQSFTKAADALAEAQNAKVVAQAAQTSASGKNNILWKTTDAPNQATNSVAGDVWYKYHVTSDNKIVIDSWWQSDGTNWKPNVLSETFLPQVNIGTGTYGSLEGNRIVAKSISADQINAQSVGAAVGTYVTLVADNILAGNLNVALNITAGQINAGNARIGQGISILNVSPDGNVYPGISLGVPGSADSFQIVSADGKSNFSISPSGDVAAQTLAVSSDPVINGTNLIGSLVQPENEVTRVNWFPSADTEFGVMLVPATVNSNSNTMSAGPSPDGVGNCLISSGGSSSNGYSYWTLNAINYQGTVGDSVTFSADVWVPSANSVQTSGGIRMSGGGLTTDVGGGGFDWTKRDQWVHYSFTTTIASPLTANTNLLFFGGVSGEKVYYKNVHFENGDTETPFFDSLWTSNNVGYVPGRQYRATGSGATRHHDEFIPQADPGLLDSLSRGVVSIASMRDMSNAMSTTYAGPGTTLIAQTTYSLPSGRTYEFQFPWRVGVQTTDSSLTYSMRLYATFSYDGSTPADPSTSDSDIFADHAQRPHNTGGAGVGGTTVVTKSVPEANYPLTMKLAVGIYSISANTKVTPSLFAPQDWMVTVKDTGSAATSVPMVTPGSAPVVPRITTWTASDCKVYNNDGTTYLDPTTNAASKTYLRQVWDPKARWNTQPVKTLFVCNGSATSGTDQGKTMSSALNGANISKVEIYIYALDWGNKAGNGEVQLRQYSGSTIPSTYASNGTATNYKGRFAGRNQGLWITVPTTWISNTNRGILINSSDWQFDNTWGVFAGSAYGTASRRPQIRVTYTK